MSRTIKDSVDLLEQSLTDCKTALTEKGVTEVDSIKISDVNEKIAEIKAGGGEELRYIENVSFGGEPINKSITYFTSLVGDGNLIGDFKFTPKEDNVQLFFTYNQKMTNDHSFNRSSFENLTKGEEYTFHFSLSTTNTTFVFLTDFTPPGADDSKPAEDVDIINFCFFS